MDAAKGTRTGSRARRKIFSCPVCDEVFVDEESLRRHELTHQNPEGAPAEEAAAAPPAPAAPAPPEDPSAVQESPAAAAPRRTLSSVRRQQAAAAAQAPDAPAQVEAPNAFLPSESATDMPVDPDATVKVPSPAAGLAPLDWEEQARKSSALRQAWTAVEDFSEWFVRGTQNTFSWVGASFVSGVTLALKGLVLLGLAAMFVYAGTWFGRVYGPRLWGNGREQPVIPPSRTLSSNPAQAGEAVRQLMADFYGAIARGDFQAAYDCLSPDWQKALPFATFQSGYKDTRSPVCVVKKVTSLNGGRYQLNVHLQVIQNGKMQKYQGTYVAVLTADGWKLDEGTFK